MYIRQNYYISFIIYWFFKRSLISVNSSTFLSTAGAGVASSFFLKRLLIILIKMKIENATMKKSTTFCMNKPYLTSAPPTFTIDP